MGIGKITLVVLGRPHRRAPENVVETAVGCS